MIFKEQQLEKKLKIQEQEKQNYEHDTLEELPQEFLQNINDHVNLNKINQNQIINSTTKSKHINFDEEDIEEDEDTKVKITQEKEKLIKEVQRQLSKKSKKKTLKNLRKKIAKKGPVTVEVLSSPIESKVMAPKKEIEVMSTKDRWLKRKSLNRK